MTTGPGTGRLSTSETARAALAALQRSERVPDFGITEERGPGGLVVPLFRANVPMCDEYPSALGAFTALLAFHTSWKAYRDAEADNLTAALHSTLDAIERGDL